MKKKTYGCEVIPRLDVCNEREAINRWFPWTKKKKHAVKT